MSKEDGFTQFVKDLEEETAPYLKFNNVIQKINKNGYLECIHLTLSSIFKHKFDSAFFGLLNRIGKTENERSQFFNSRSI